MKGAFIVTANILDVNREKNLNLFNFNKSNVKLWSPRSLLSFSL